MKTITNIFLGVSFAAPTIALANFGSYGDGYGMMGYGGGMMGGFGFFMVAGGLVWTAVGILACVWLWQNINKK